MCCSAAFQEAICLWKPKEPRFQLRVVWGRWPKPPRSATLPRQLSAETPGFLQQTKRALGSKAKSQRVVCAQNSSFFPSEGDRTVWAGVHVLNWGFGGFGATLAPPVLLFLHLHLSSRSTPGLKATLTLINEHLPVIAPFNHCSRLQKQTSLLKTKYYPMFTPFLYGNHPV